MILTLMLTRVTVFVKGIEDPVQLRIGAVKIGDTPYLIIFIFNFGIFYHLQQQFST